MTGRHHFEVIIAGGSYSGLAAGMALGRALRRVLIIDSGKPCNRQTPHSHNFLTQDGKTPKEITALGKQQVEAYGTVEFVNGLVTGGTGTDGDFEIRLESGESYRAKKLVFATGIKDIMPDIEGFAECWGISVLHCPYCHGYEVRNERTGILENGEGSFGFSRFISNWTKELTLFTNGASALTSEQAGKLEGLQIGIVENEIEKLEHSGGRIRNILFKDHSRMGVRALYSRLPFEQHCHVPEELGCELTAEGYLKTDPAQRTTVKGIFACGDSTTHVRTIANAVATGTAAGMAVSRELIEEGR